MKAECPDCARPFDRRERARLFGGGLWQPRTADCPQCGATLRWKPAAWRMQLVGALSVVLAIPRILPGEARAALAAAGIFAVLFAVATLRLERADQATS